MSDQPPPIPPTPGAAPGAESGPAGRTIAETQRESAPGADPSWSEASRTITPADAAANTAANTAAKPGGGEPAAGPTWSDWMRQLPSRESVVVSVATPALAPAPPVPDVPADVAGAAGAERGGDFVLGGAPDATAPGTRAVGGVVDTGARTLRRRGRPGSGELRGPAAPDFELREMIGQGGQGEVWRAWQTSLCREVAVKRLKSGDLTEFLQEAFTSAELDHPNIVPVHDLGRVGDGDGERDVPLLAMKMVRGTPWNILIARDRLPSVFSLDRMLTRHLRILIDVCNAVAYAHSKGIIHRDLKPHQVMVGSFGEVFLMDWGLAVSVLDRAPTVVHEGIPKFRTLHTSTNQCGSPAYMAPEQTDDTTERLGFHTDIYLLGAILFELVVGEPPHASSSAQAAYLMAVTNELNSLPPDTPDELRTLLVRSLATDPAARPGSVTGFRDALEDYLTGAGRRRESRQLVDEAAKELARLETRPSPEYGPIARLQQQTARALHLWPQNRAGQELSERLTTLHAERALAAHDLQLARSLAESLPASNARRTPLIEQVARLVARAGAVRRQRQVFLATSFVLVAVVVVLVATFKVREARAEAVTTRLEAETVRSQERAREQRERADILSSVNALREAEDRLAEELSRRIPLPETIDAAQGDAETTRVAELPRLVARRAELEAERSRLAGAGIPLEAQPVALLIGEANLRLRSAADTTSSLEAFELYATAHRRRPEHPDPLTGMGIAAARAGFATSASLYLEEATSRTLEARGEGHPDYARALALEGDALRQIDDSGEEYLAYYRKSLEVLEPGWAKLTATIGERKQSIGSYREAHAMTSQALDAYIRLKGGESGEVARQSVLMARASNLIGDYRGASEHAARAVALYGTLGKSEGAEAADANLALAASYYNLGRINDSLDIHRRNIEMQRARSGNASLEVADSMLALAHILSAMRRNGEAAELFAQALAIREATLGPDHPKVALTLRSIAINLDALGRPAEATPIYARVLDILRGAAGEKHPYIPETYYSLAKNLYDQNRSAEAEPYARRGLELSLEVLGPEHPMVALAYHNIGRISEDLGRLSESNEYYVKALAIHRARYGDDHPETATSLNNLAVNLSRMGRHAEAEPLLRRAIDVHAHVYGAYHPDLAINLGNLAQCIRRLGRPEEAHTYYERSLRILRFSIGDDHPETLWALHLMGRSLEEVGRPDEGMAYWLAALQARLRVLGEGNMETVDSYESIGSVLSRQGRHADAEQFYLRGWRLFAGLYGTESPRTAQHLDSIPRCLVAQGRFDDAVALDLALLDLRRVHQGGRRSNVIDSYWGLARDLQGRGDGAEAAAFAQAAMARALTEEDATSGALVGRWDTYLRVTAGRNDIPEAEYAALCLRIGAVLDATRRAAGETTPWDLGVEPASPEWLDSEQALTSATLELDPPRRDVARQLVLRGEAMARLMDLPTTHTLRREFLDPRIAELDLSEAVAALPASPADLTVRESSAIDATGLFAFLDAVAGPVSWTAIDPTFVGDPWALIPPREEAEQRLVAIEARLRERTPAALPPLVDASGDARVQQLVEEMVAAHPLHLEPVPDYLPRLLEGNDRYHRGEFATAAEAFDRALVAADADIARGGEESVAARGQLVPITYSGASCHARLGHVDRAFELLDRAVDAGFVDADKLRRDTDLEALREDTERFAALLERVAAQGGTAVGAH